MEQKSKITIDHMDLYYGDFHALKNIHMNLPENEISALSDLVDAANQPC